MTAPSTERYYERLQERAEQFYWYAPTHAEPIILLTMTNQELEQHQRLRGYGRYAKRYIAPSGRN